MAEIPADRLIIGASLIFFVGIFVFAIIYKGLILVASVQDATIGVLQGENTRSAEIYANVFQFIPWILGFMYIVFVGGVVYFVIIKGRGRQVQGTESEYDIFNEMPSAPQEVEESFEDIFYK